MPEPALTLLFAQRFGAVDRIMSLLRRRGFPISGMTLERTHREDVGRMTVTVQESRVLPQVRLHLQKLPDVLEVTSAGEADTVHREYALARIRCTPQQRDEVMALLIVHDARAVSATEEHMIVEASGPGCTLDALFSKLAPFGIEESARTSPMALRSVPATYKTA